MSKLKAYAKALPIYWMARQSHAKKKYAQALSVLSEHPWTPSAGPDPRPTVLIFSSMGVFADHLVVDTLLARELERQGARVIVVLCDGQLPACHVSDRYAYAYALTPAARGRQQKRMCASCTSSTQELRRDSKLSYASFSEGIEYAQRHGGGREPLDLSDEVKSGVIRFAASSHQQMLDELPADVHERYAEGAERARLAIEGLFDKFQPTTVIAHHGIYLPQGVVQKIARQRKVGFYSWHFGYRKSTLIFSRGDTYHRELTAAQPSAFERPLDAPQRERIMKYLQSRMTGGQDWIHFNRTPKAFDGSNSSRRYFVLYTSVDWDAALHFPASVFSSQFEFLDKLVELFRDVPEHDLIIRVHPAEVTGFHPAALSVEDHLRTVQLPPNVRVVPARDTTSSYELAKGCIAAIVYNTKLGIELPPVGIPVIVAGDCWIRDKGFSYDVGTLADLERYVRMGTALQVSETERERALQFAHYFYYRRCIDTPELVSTGPKFQVGVCSDGMKRSKNEGNGIPFIAGRILSDENVQLAA